VKAKSSKWRRDLHTAIPIVLGTVPLTSYQQPVVPVGLKPPEEVNGESANVPAGTGGATIGYNVPPPMGEPQAPENASRNIPSSDSNAQEAPNVQPTMPPQGPTPTPSLYPDLCKYIWELQGICVACCTNSLMYFYMLIFCTFHIFLTHSVMLRLF